MQLNFRGISSKIWVCDTSVNRREDGAHFEVIVDNNALAILDERRVVARNNLDGYEAEMGQLATAEATLKGKQDDLQGQLVGRRRIFNFSATCSELLPVGSRENT